MGNFFRIWPIRIHPVVILSENGYFKTMLCFSNKYINSRLTLKYASPQFILGISSAGYEIPFSQHSFLNKPPRSFLKILSLEKIRGRGVRIYKS